MLRTLDDERAALALRLHDGPQQTMTAVRLMCDVIADAIRTGDVELASAAMRVHLTVVAQAIERDLARMEIESNSAQKR
jgi:signal transduction histidine kinase